MSNGLFTNKGNKSGAIMQRNITTTIMFVALSVMSVIHESKFHMSEAINAVPGQLNLPYKLPQKEKHVFLLCLFVI